MRFRVAALLRGSRRSKLSHTEEVFGAPRNGARGEARAARR